jgi:hypothetical protein
MTVMSMNRQQFSRLVVFDECTPVQVCTIEARLWRCTARAGSSDVTE